MGMTKIKMFFIGGATIAVLVAGIYVGVKFFGGEADAQETIVVTTIGEEVYEITNLEIGEIQNKIKETYVATTPIKETLLAENKQGNAFYNTWLGMKKVVELDYNAIVHWGYRGDVNEDSLEYDSKTKTLTINEPQLTAFYLPKLVDSREDLGYNREMFDDTTYDDMALYESQAYALIEDIIKKRVETGRTAVQESLRKDINKLIEDGIIETPIENIVFEESKEQLDIINEEVEELEITELEEDKKEDKKEKESN